MKLANKEEHKFPQNDKPKEYKPVKVDWSKFKIDPEKELPHGKNAGKTVQWVIDNDENYYSWMIKNDIFGSWGLIIEKHHTVNKVSGFRCDNGEVWIDIYLVDI